MSLRCALRPIRPNASCTWGWSGSALLHRAQPLTQIAELEHRLQLYILSILMRRRVLGGSTSFWGSQLGPHSGYTARVRDAPIFAGRKLALVTQTILIPSKPSCCRFQSLDRARDKKTGHEAWAVVHTAGLHGCVRSCTNGNTASEAD